MMKCGLFLLLQVMLPSAAAVDLGATRGILEKKRTRRLGTSVLINMNEDSDKDKDSGRAEEIAKWKEELAMYQRISRDFGIKEGLDTSDLDSSKMEAEELVEKGVGMPPDVANAILGLTQLVHKTKTGEDDSNMEKHKKKVLEELPTKFRAVADAMAKMEESFSNTNPNLGDSGSEDSAFLDIRNALQVAVQQVRKLQNISANAGLLSGDADSGIQSEQSRILEQQVDVGYDGRTFNYNSQDQHQKEEEEDRSDYSSYRHQSRRNYQGHRNLGFVPAFHEAVLNGDHDQLHRHIDRFMSYADRARDTVNNRAGHASQRERRTSDGDKGNKADQCALLVECASKLSRYDLFVYMFERDGEVVEDVYRFDGDSFDGFSAKYDRIKKERVPQAQERIDLGTFQDGDECDMLLDEFHRTEKIGFSENAPYHVVQGIVTEICLAEGNRKYLPLKDIHEAQPLAAIEVLKDTIDCAIDLHQFGGNDPYLANFPFRHQDILTIFFQDIVDEEQFKLLFPYLLWRWSFTTEVWQVPVDLNDANRGDHGEIIHPDNFFIFEDITNEYWATLRNIDGRFDLVSREGAWTEGIYEKLLHIYREWFFETPSILAPEFGLVCEPEDSEVPSMSPSVSLVPSVSPSMSSPPTTYLNTPPSQAPSTSSYPSASPSRAFRRYDCRLGPVDSNGDFIPSSELPSFITASEPPLQVEFFWTETIYNNDNAWADPEHYMCTNLCQTDVGSFFPADSYTGSGDDARLNPSFLEKIDKGFEFVFGKGVSVGYVCGLQGPPGKCCLDSPIESSLWGTAHSCSDGCTNLAPVLAGISPEACDVYGGTFCYETNCTALKDCIEEEIANPNGNEVYLEYINLAPKITNVDSEAECGDTREYFGFEPIFNNDKLICEDIRQLRNTRDFSILGDFQGGGGGDGDNPAAVHCPSGLYDPGDPCKIDEGGALAWRITNFVLGLVLDILEIVRTTINNIECPCLPCIPIPLCIITAICEAIKAIISNIMLVIILIFRVLISISEFIYGWLAGIGGLSRIKIYDAIDKVYPNLEITDGYVKQRADAIDKKLDFGFCFSVTNLDEGHSHDVHDGTVNFLEKYNLSPHDGDGKSMADLYEEVLCRPVPNLARGHGCDGIDNNCDIDYIPDDCDEDKYKPEIDFAEATALCGPDKQIFKDWQAAEDCVKTFVSITDDCYDIEQPTFLTIEATYNVSTCGKTFDVTVTAQEVECGKVEVDTFQVVVIDKLLNGEGTCTLPRGPDTLPILDVSQAISSCSGRQFWNSTEEAIKCIERYTVASDPCRDVFTTVSLVKAGQVNGCGPEGSEYYDVTVRAEIAGCPNDLFVEETMSMMILVDPNAKQTPSCTFSIGPDDPPSLETNDVHSLCVGKMFPELPADFAKNAEDCILEFTDTDDVSGSCRPVVTTATSVVNTSLSLANCETKYVDVTVESQILGCSGLSSEETFSVVLDPSITDETCDYGHLGPYRDPIIDSTVAFTECHGATFATLEEATDCIMQFTTAEDPSGCRPLTLTPDDPMEISSCSWNITVTATIDSCVALQTTSEPITVYVDNIRPIVSCSFGQGIDETGPGVFVNPILSYDVQDNCNGSFNVTMETFSNEIDKLNPMGVHGERPSNGAQEKHYDVFLSAAICNTGNSGSCIPDPSANGRRFYVTQVTATDLAGLQGFAQCFVEVIPTSGPAGDPYPTDGTAKFNQLFVLDKTDFKYNFSLAV